MQNEKDHVDKLILDRPIAQSLPELVYIVYFRKDFYSSPMIIGCTLSKETARAIAWEHAKRKWRYAGPMREDYTHFEQSIKVDSYQLR